MSQATDWSVPLSGPVTPNAMVQRMDDSYDALLSSHSGASRPAYAVAGTVWLSTATAGQHKYYHYDGASDRLIMTIDTTTGAITWPGGTVSGAVNFENQELSNPAGKWLRGYMSPSFNLANNATDATNDIDFPAGVVASEATVPFLMEHAASTAQLDAAFGTGNGGRFDSVISDGTWHCFIISNGTTVSRGFSKSLNPTSAPNYPSSYTHYRRIGSIIRASAAILPFIQHEDTFWHNNATTGGILDIDVTNPGTSAATRTLTVPLGIQVDAIINLGVNNTSGAASVTTVTPLELANVSPGSTVASGLWNTTLGSGLAFAQRGEIRTNTSGQVRSRTSVSGASITVQIGTLGWKDSRGRL